MRPISRQAKDLYGARSASVRQVLRAAHRAETVHPDNCLRVDYPTTSGTIEEGDFCHAIAQAETPNEKPQYGPHSSPFIGLRHSSADVSRICHVPRRQYSYPVKPLYEVSTG
jgi:hypothetical protein